MFDDYQKSKVYAWEDTHIAPRIDTSNKSENFLSSLCKHMWKAIGRVNPPSVYEYSAYKKKSTGNRYTILFAPQMMNEHILVHELAHSLNHVEDDSSNGDSHGPNYVADYILLLTTFYGFDVLELLYTCQTAGIHVNQSRLYNAMAELKG